MLKHLIVYVFKVVNGISLEHHEMKILAEAVGLSLFTYLPLTSGTYELYLVAVDNVGNKGKLSKPSFLTVLEGKLSFQLTKLLF